MMPEINYYAILACGVASMVLGFIWYGPLFGKKWMKLMNLGVQTPEEMKKAQKEMMPTYILTFVLALFQAWVLSYYIKGWTDASGVENSLWIWGAFVIPTIFGGTMWNGSSKKVAWSRFCIQGGYYLVLFVIFGLILGYWK